MAGFNKDEKGKWIEKDPSALLDYSIDWSAWLQPGETITTSTWVVTAGIVVTDSDNSPTVATVWLSGGTTLREYTVANKVTTTGGRQDERSFRVRVVNR